MSQAEPTVTAPSARLFDLRSGGWLVLVAATLCLATVVIWAIRIARQPLRVGDGHDVASYRFDLTTCLVPRAQIVGSGLSRDGLPALTSPRVFTVAEADAYSQELRSRHQGKFLVGTERVIGVVVEGVARAYPLRILNWHEVVNDTLGGWSLAVTYNPLCDSAVVFDRRVGDEALEFGVSGLLYNSNLLLYDRRPGSRGESLWSQLQARAITGPAAERGRTLRIVAAAVVPWSAWRDRHPETTVLAPDPARLKAYKNSYKPYFGSDQLYFPVTPLPPADGPHAKTPVLAVRTTGRWHAFAVPEIVAQAGVGDVWRRTIDGLEVQFAVCADPLTVWPHDADVETIYAFWFAWHALHPDLALER